MEGRRPRSSLAFLLITETKWRSWAPRLWRPRPPFSWFFTDLRGANCGVVSAVCFRPLTSPACQGWWPRSRPRFFLLVIPRANGPQSSGPNRFQPPYVVRDGGWPDRLDEVLLTGIRKACPAIQGRTFLLPSNGLIERVFATGCGQLSRSRPRVGDLRADSGSSRGPGSLEYPAKRPIRAIRSPRKTASPGAAPCGHRPSSGGFSPPSRP